MPGSFLGKQVGQQPPNGKGPPDSVRHSSQPCSPRLPLAVAQNQGEVMLQTWLLGFSAHTVEPGRAH